MKTTSSLGKQTGILLETGTNEMELLTITVGSQIFGINVAKVQSIQQYDPTMITPFPETVHGIQGMFLYREKTIPLLDLSQLLHVDTPKNSDREIVVVTEFNNAVNAFRVQGVNRIYRLSWENFIPLDNLLDTGTFFTGSVHLEETQVLIIDLEHILGLLFPEQILETLDQGAVTPEKSHTRQETKLYFAEDSPTLRRALIKELETAGYTDLTAFENGELAYKYIKGHHPSRPENQRTILITDIEMPRMDGLTLCHKVKQDPALNDIYVVMFSSLINKQMITKCQRVKADNYVTKPEINQLIDILDP